MLRVLDDAAAALHLDGLDAGLLQESAGVVNCVLRRCVVSHERHITDDQRVGSAANDGAGVADHVVHRHAQRVGVAKHGHAQAVTDEEQGNTGAVQPAGGGVVVGRQHGEILAFGLPFA